MMTSRKILFVVAFLLFIFTLYILVSPNDLKVRPPSPSPSSPNDIFFSKFLNLHSKKRRAIADPKQSYVKLLKNKTMYTVGETLHVLIVLRDVNGNPITAGGDALRIWLKEGKSNVNGEIIDHNNGSYTGSILLPWAGNLSFYVSIANERQHTSYVMAAIDIHKLLFPIYATFVHNDLNSVTTCGPATRNNGWNDTCNLTNINYNVEWYCEKPSNPEIKCSDWKYVNTKGGSVLPKETVAWIRSHKQMVIVNRTDLIQVNGSNHATPKSNISCASMNRSHTWIIDDPVGFYYKGSWINMLCNQTLKKHPDDYKKCLRGRHLFVIGDSNSRSIVSYLRSYLDLKMFTGFVVAGKPWQKRVYAKNRNLNISVTWTPHGLPFSSPPLFERELLVPSFIRLNRIGSRNNSIILIHMYMHIARAPLKTFRDHIRRLRYAAEKLLKRSPNVDIVIKGPHSITYRGVIDPLDYISLIHKQIWLEEFRGLYHKVIYLDMWDITSGGENVHVHPDSKTLSDMIHTFLSYICK